MKGLIGHFKEFFKSRNVTWSDLFCNKITLALELEINGRRVKMEAERSLRGYYNRQSKS